MGTNYSPGDVLSFREEGNVIVVFQYMHRSLKIVYAVPGSVVKMDPDGNILTDPTILTTENKFSIIEHFSILIQGDEIKIGTDMGIAAIYLKVKVV